MCEYTDGTLLLTTLGGIPSSQRSGLHVLASGPQSPSSVLIPVISAMIVVPFGSGTDRITWPSIPMTSQSNAKTVSDSALHGLRKTKDAQNERGTYCRVTNGTDGYLRMSGMLMEIKLRNEQVGLHSKCFFEDGVQEWEGHDGIVVKVSCGSDLLSKASLSSGRICKCLEDACH